MRAYDTSPKEVAPLNMTGVSSDGDSRYFMVFPSQGSYYLVADGSGIGRLSEVSFDNCSDGCFDFGSMCPLDDLRCENTDTIVSQGSAAFAPSGFFDRVDFEIAEGYTISGTVFERDGTTPVTGTSLGVFDALIGTATSAMAMTAGDGSYTTFPPLPDSASIETAYAVEARNDPEFEPEMYDEVPCAANGTCDKTQATPISLSADRTGIDFTLDPVLYPITGQVTDSETGDPLFGATVCALDPGGNPTGVCDPDGTDGSGNYSLMIRAGDYQIEASQTEFSSARYMDGGLVTVNNDAPGASNIDIALDPIKYTISGRVLDAETGAGIEGANVSIFDSDGIDTGMFATTASDGSYTTPGFRAGTFFAVADHPEFIGEAFSEMTCEGCNLQTISPTAINLGPDAVDVDFTLDPVLYTVSGTVTDVETTDPIVGATVCIEVSGGGTPDCSAITDGSGNYTTPGVRAGDYDVTASAGGYADNTLAGLSVSSMTGNLTGQDLALQRLKGAITGTVRLEDAGSPISGIRIAVFDIDGVFVTETLSELDGTYLVSDLPTADYFVAADGSVRGFVSEVYSGRDGMNELIELTCTDNTCDSTEVIGGMPVPVTDSTTTMDIDFELRSGDVLAPEDLAALDEMGRSVAICGQRAAIGVPGDDNERGTDAGAVLIYVKEGSGYVFSQKLLPDEDPADGARFGSSVSCDGNLIVIGAPGDGVVAKKMAAKGSGPSKSAYVMQLGLGGTSTTLGQLVAGNLGSEGTGIGPDSGWGSSVSIQGGTIAIGAPNATEQTSGMNSGAVMMFSTANIDPSNATVISDPDANSGAGFGMSVSVNSGNVAVGAPNQNNPNAGNAPTGLAQLFTNLSGTNDWGNVGKFGNPAGGGANDGFGTAVSLQGGMMAIGSPGDDSAGEDAGAAFVFQFDEGGNFTQVGNTILPNDPSAGSKFGSSISLAGNSLAVGAPEANGNAEKSGAGYLFGLVSGLWNQVAQALAENANTGDLFGAAVAYDGNNFVIGAPNGTTQGQLTGYTQAFVNADRLFQDGYEQ